MPPPRLRVARGGAARLRRRGESGGREDSGGARRGARRPESGPAALLRLASDDPLVRTVAAAKLGELCSQNGVTALKKLVAVGESTEATEPEKVVAKAAGEAIQRIENWGFWSNVIETCFRGISLSSVLLIMSLGLAIVFGLMGVINMAHGELMMVGAYATFVTQQCFMAWFPSDVFDWYF